MNIYMIAIRALAATFIVAGLIFLITVAVVHADPQGTWWQSDDGSWSLVGRASTAAEETEWLMATGCASLERMP